MVSKAFYCDVCGVELENYFTRERTFVFWKDANKPAHPTVTIMCRITQGDACNDCIKKVVSQGILQHA